MEHLRLINDYIIPNITMGHLDKDLSNEDTSKRNV